MSKQATSPVLLVAAIMLCAGPVLASDWSGTDQAWNSNTNPGWNGTGIPNGQGAIANFGAAAAVTGNVQNTGGSSVTVGTISFSAGDANVTRTITVTTGIGLKLDQDANFGSGTATISNTNASTGSNNQLLFTGGGIELHDDLLVSNTGGSTNATGAIRLSSSISGVGNVTFSNVSTALSSTGSIRLDRFGSDFGGAVLLQKGTVTYTVSTAFGGAANPITLGQAGQGDVALLATAATFADYHITVAAGTGGTSTLGSLDTSLSSVAYNGPITLNGSVNLLTASPVANSNVLTFSGAITGAGGVTASASGTSPVAMTLSGNNSFTGTTTINNNVTLRAAGSTASNKSLGGTSGVIINAGGTLLLGAANQINNAAGISLAGGKFNTGGFSEGTAASGGAGVGALTLTANSTIDFGAGSNSILHFAGLGAHTSGTGSDLAITNWNGITGSGGSGDRLLFTGSAADFTSQYSQTDVSFNGIDGYRAVQFGDFYEVTAAPEPSTYAAGLLALAALGFTQRRRIQLLLSRTAAAASR